MSGLGRDLGWRLSGIGIWDSGLSEKATVPYRWHEVNSLGGILDDRGRGSLHIGLQLDPSSFSHDHCHYQPDPFDQSCSYLVRMLA